MKIGMFMVIFVFGINLTGNSNETSMTKKRFIESICNKNTQCTVHNESIKGYFLTNRKLESIKELCEGLMIESLKECEFNGYAAKKCIEETTCYGVNDACKSVCK